MCFQPPKAALLHCNGCAFSRRKQPFYNVTAVLSGDESTAVVIRFQSFRVFSAICLTGRSPCCSCRWPAAKTLRHSARTKTWCSRISARPPTFRTGVPWRPKTLPERKPTRTRSCNSQTVWNETPQDRASHYRNQGPFALNFQIPADITLILCNFAPSYIDVYFK